MLHKRMMAFCKSANCPSSDNVLSYLNGRLSREASHEVGVHLASCDFCSAESDFFRHFPQLPDEQVQPMEIPAHLYQLAEALLNNSTRGVISLSDILLDESDADGGLV